MFTMTWVTCHSDKSCIRAKGVEFPLTLYFLKIFVVQRTGVFELTSSSHQGLFTYGITGNWSGPADDFELSGVFEVTTFEQSKFYCMLFQTMTSIFMKYVCMNNFNLINL